ncbi:MAG: methyl-accepting chemotaxis protein [Nitrospirae bacterium]|nr:methyl-accepting chemotaxis protein [Nitrospirota bacterium]
MSVFKNMKIGTRLVLGFGMLIMLMLVIAFTGVTRLASIDKQLDVIVHDRYPKTVWANNIIDGVNRIARSMRNILIMDDKNSVIKEIEGIRESRKNIGENVDKLERTIKSEKGKEIMKAVKDLRSAYINEQEGFMKLIENGKKDEAKTLLLTKIRPVQLSYMDAVDKLIKFQNDLMETGGKEAKQEYLNARNLMIILGVIALAMAVAIIFLVTRSITLPLSRAVGAANQIAEGDLTAKIEITGKDETGQLLTAMENMVKNLKQIVFQTKEASNQVATASDQIAQANQNLSQSITEQASSVEETTSTMEEMTASIRQTADNAREANKLAQNTKGIAESGSSVMDDTIKAMDDINKSSSKIANISNVIEEIAFQTNLLALNAAVEAARAGEHGKGFAVVASEIRNLAQRASQSAKEITGLIEDSGEKTGKGVQLAQELSTKLREIEGSVKKVADLMDEVAAAAQEQATGTNQVNTAMTQIDQATQQNASIVEETASASEELAAQAKELMNLISFFRVDEGEGFRESRAGSRAVVTHEPQAAKRTAKHLFAKAAQKEEKKALHAVHELAGAAAVNRTATAEKEKSNGGFEEF